MRRRRLQMVASPSASARCRLWRVVGLVLGALSLGGCQGGGRVQFINLNTRQIDERKPFVTSTGLDRGYWWTDEQDRLHLALGVVSSDWLGGPRLFIVSLDLDKLPAGSAKDYSLRSPALQAVSQGGGRLVRLTAYQGIVAIWRENGDVLRGRFRSYVWFQNFNILTGWSQRGLALLVGDFTAIHDPRRGPELAAQSKKASEHP